MPFCPCGSKKKYNECCEPYLSETHTPTTPEQLMRSRYTAYSQADIAYIKKTMMGKPLITFNEEEAILWAKNVHWLGLQVIKTSQNEPNVGYVEFIATLIERNQLKKIHERSEFRIYNGRWFYVDGLSQQNSIKKYSTKLARNAVCPCGSGKKFKNCHEQ